MNTLIKAAAAAAVIALGASAVSAQMQSKQDKEVTGKPTNEDAAKNNSAATGSGSGTQSGTSTKEEAPTDPNEKKGPLVKQIEKEGKKSP
jgi:uncharacterized membrane protein